MNLKELKTYIDNIYNSCRNPENISILITLCEGSIGPRASAGVKNMHLGFDWEHGQFRIEPEIPLVRKDKPKSSRKIKE